MNLTRTNLIEYFLKGCKPANQQTIGIEIESFICNQQLQPLNVPTTNKILQYFVDHGWQAKIENKLIKSLNSEIGNITLEPGLQLEFSSLPEKDIIKLDKVYKKFLTQFKHATEKVQAAAFSMGFHPYLDHTEIPLINAPRYNFMYGYMPKVGTLGTSMMKNTTTLQPNFDYYSPQDLQQKVQVIANIIPFLIYFSASSPFYLNKVSPYLSFRNYVWEHTDNQRSGVPNFYFNNQFTIEKYVDYIIDIPMYFRIINNKYIVINNGYTFLDAMQGKIANFNPTLEDFILHLSTTFTDIRIKNYLEIRSCDTFGFKNALTIPALLTGLLYNSNSLEQLYDITNTWNIDTFKALKTHLNTKGLTKDMVAGINIQKFAANLLELAHQGLSARKLKEEKYLAPLKEMLATGNNVAQTYINLFSKAQHSVNKFLPQLFWK